MSLCMVARPRIGSGDLNSENWLMRSLSTESLWFTSTAAVKDLRGGFRLFLKKALELMITISASGGVVKESCEKIFTESGRHQNAGVRRVQIRSIRMNRTRGYSGH